MLINRLFAVLLFIGFFSVSLGQTDTFTVNSVRTNLHKPIPGTTVFMELPSKEIEFMDNMPIVFFPRSNLTVYALTMMNYYDISPTLTREELNRTRVSFSDYQEARILGMPGKLVSMDGDPENGSEILLVFGDSSQTFKIVANYEYANKAERAKLLQLLSTIWFDQSMMLQTLENAPFALEIPDSSFQFVNYATNSYFFNQSGNKKFDINSEPFFLIGLLPMTETKTLDEYNKIIPDLLQQFGFTPEQIDATKTITINGVEARESTFEFYARGKKRQIYCMMMVKGELCLFLMGISFFDYEKYIQNYRTIASTITIK